MVCFTLSIHPLTEVPTTPHLFAKIRKSVTVIKLKKKKIIVGRV